MTNPTDNLKLNLDAFLNDLRMQPLSIHTLEAYKLDLVDFSRHILKERADKVSEGSLFAEVVNCTSKDFISYLDHLGFCASATMARRFASLRRFLNWAHSKELRLKALPEFPKLRREQKLAPKWLTKPQVEALLAKAKQRDHCTSLRNVVMIQLMLHTGLRVGEVVSLRWEHIVLKKDEALLKVVAGKGKKDRLVPLNFFIRSVLEKYREERQKINKNAPYLFYGGRGKINSDAVLRAFYSLAKELDFKVTPHHLRHTFCKNLLNKGVPLHMIADLAGHSSLRITQRYVGASLLDLAVSVEKLNDF